MTVSDFRAVFDKLTPNGWLMVEEALCLVDWANRTNGPILEVGCYYGRSTVLLAHLSRPMFCVDPWEDKFSKPTKGDDVYAQFRKSVHEVGNASVWIYRERIEDWRPCCKMAFAYLDGDHSYQGTVAQIEKALQCSPQVVAVHDVNDTGGGVEIKRACLEMLGNWDERVERLAIWSRGSILKHQSR